MKKTFPPPSGQAPWFTYIVRCSDNTLYSGIAKDLKKRLEEHNHGPGGAKYTKARRPVTLVYFEECADRSEASRREYQLKRMTRTEKLNLIQKKEKGQILS